jgi:phenylalanyl-tRNA synthetase beta chain
MGRKRNENRKYNGENINETGGATGRLEGRNPILEALKAEHTINRIYIEKGLKDPVLEKIYAVARSKGIVVSYLDKAGMNQMSETRNHQGVIADVSPYSYAEVEDILKSLEFGVERSGDVFTIQVPSFRATKDISMKADIIEEISRIHGYDNIKPETIKVDLQPLDYNEERLTEHRIRDILSEKFALSEVNSYIWYNNTFNNAMGIGQHGSVKLLNPHAKDMDMLRDSMVPQMLEFAEVNRKVFDEFGIFEIGSIFKAPDVKTKCDPNKNLCVLLASKVKSEDVLFYELKGITTTLMKLLKNVDVTYSRAENSGFSWIHPVKSVVAVFEGKNLGTVSCLHPQIKQNLDKKLNIAFVELEMPVVHAVQQTNIKYAEPSRYPEVTLDFCFLVDKAVNFDKLTADVAAYNDTLLQDFSYIGIYTGKGLPEDKKSMTFRFIIGSKEKTLSSEDITNFSNNLLGYMKSNGYELR